MLTVDCQPLQSFARLNKCRDQSFWSLDNEREKMKKARKRGMARKNEGKARELAALQMLEYTHNTHTDTHWAVDAPLSVWHWCCQTNQGTISLALTCSLVLEKKPDSCDVVMTSSCCCTVFGVSGSSLELSVKSLFLWCPKTSSTFCFRRLFVWRGRNSSFSIGV